MNKKLMIAALAAVAMAFGAYARPHHGGPGPGFGPRYHHHHHGGWGRGGRYGWPGVVGGGVAGPVEEDAVDAGAEDEVEVGFEL